MSGLPLQRFPEFAEKKPGIFIADDRLRGEVRLQRDLPIGERRNFLAIDAHHAD